MHWRGRFDVPVVLVATGVCWLWCSGQSWSGHPGPGGQPWDLQAVLVVGTALGLLNFLLAALHSTRTWAACLVFPLGLVSVGFAAQQYVFHMAQTVAALPYFSSPGAEQSHDRALPYALLLSLGLVQAAYGLPECARRVASAWNGRRTESRQPLENHPIGRATVNR